MIKRPLVWILCAYLMGMYLAWQRLPIPVIIISLLLFVALIYLFLYRFKNKFINRRDQFLWCLPLLMLLGFFALRDQLAVPKLFWAFDQEINCELTGNISMVVNRQWGKALYVKNNTISFQEEDQYICENVIVYCYNEQGSTNSQEDVTSINYLVGNQITVYGTLQKFSEASNPGQFNEKLYYQIENIDFKMEAESISITDPHYSAFHSYLDQVKSKLLEVYESILAEKEAGTIIAMLLGEKYLLDDEIKQLYQVNGISHVLAISGLHISLIGMFIFWLLKKLKVPVVPATLITIFFIYCYGVLTNFSVSTNRAVVMMTVLLLSGIIGKTYDMYSSLSLSAFIILLQNPLQILSAGFLLSFGAVIGIAAVYPCLQKLYETKNQVLQSLYISISAQITTTPFVLYFYYQFPTYSVLTNLIVLPFVTVLTLTSIFAGITGAIYKPLGLFLIGGANYILKFYEWVCIIFTKLPKNLITTGRPELSRLFIYTLLILLFIWCAKRYNSKYSVLILTLSILVLLLPIRCKGLEITLLDVGQGDAIYMESSNQTTYLIDGGSSDVSKVGCYRIQPFLLYQGCGCLDYAIITHSDSDHISGLTELIEAERIEINNLVLPEISNKDDAYLELERLAIEKKIAVSYIGTGDFIWDGDVRILCLYPVKGYEAVSSNAYSTVLSVNYKEFDLLLTGDLQKEGEEEVVNLLTEDKKWEKCFAESYKDLERVTDYDVLKVAHHGSKYSSEYAFLQLIQPELSLISCGRGNKKVTRLIQFRFVCSALQRAYYKSFCGELLRDNSKSLARDNRLKSNNYNCLTWFAQPY